MAVLLDLACKPPRARVHMWKGHYQMVCSTLEKVFLGKVCRTFEGGSDKESCLLAINCLILSSVAKNHASRNQTDV